MPKLLSDMQGFSTQTELMKKFNMHNSQGLCRPLSNLYAKHRLGLSDNFLNKNDADMLATLHAEQEKQSALGKTLGWKGELFSAFHEGKIDYDITETQHPPSKPLLDEVVNHSDHVFINFPTSASDTPPYSDRHQIYLGKLPEVNRCAYFNANRPGGEVLNNCDRLTQQIFDDMQKEGLFDGRPTVFAMAKK